MLYTHNVVYIQHYYEKPKQIIELIAETVSNWKQYAKQAEVEKQLAKAIEQTLWII